MPRSCHPFPSPHHPPPCSEHPLQQLLWDPAFTFRPSFPGPPRLSGRPMRPPRPNQTAPGLVLRASLSLSSFFFSFSFCLPYYEFYKIKEFFFKNLRIGWLRGLHEKISLNCVITLRNQRSELKRIHKIHITSKWVVLMQFLPRACAPRACFPGVKCSSFPRSNGQACFAKCGSLNQPRR